MLIVKALTFHGKHQIRFEDTPDPRIESPDDVIVKVRLCAICGSDLHVYHEYEKGLDLGTPMGHEFMGEIVESGKNVKGFKKGDLVLSTLMNVPEGISDEEALLLGDIIPTGYYCARQAEIKPGDTQVVVGCGPVG